MNKGVIPSKNEQEKLQMEYGEGESKVGQGRREKRVSTIFLPNTPTCQTIHDK
ncbi:hypothetical protein A2U01_0104154, partial [Trifolium medium]|nr:hypothetical protein [Trifolium medium]